MDTESNQDIPYLDSIKIIDYLEYTSEFKDKLSKPINGVPLDAIYDITLNQEMFDEYYGVFSDTIIALKSLGKKFGIKSPNFYFVPYTGVNAGVYSINDSIFFFISAGLINYFFNYFKDAIEIFRENDQLKHIINGYEYNSGLDIYMLKCVCEFVSFHEYAHLIQNSRDSNKGVSYFSESTEDSNILNFNLEQHLREIDADNLATKLTYRFMKYYHADKFATHNRQTILNRISVTLSTILLYFYRMHHTFGDFYTSENKHPHHLIRTFIITHEFVQLIREDSELRYLYTREEILSQVHRICKFVSGFDPKELSNISNKYRKEMNDYMELINSKSKLYPYLITSNLSTGH